ncbi:VOC family protein [Nocardioides sp. AX2bis]|uniref:VOC family protein n=1 Tax=Nocardioides sp. AX2bis TaxID=2653157 RepID=UPI0012F0EF11|nr:VOC family protein [Nocardioides sp. AX2bis]VXB57019.1 Glyoxalase [Nocardioides sp. AX2bis]
MEHPHLMHTALDTNDARGLAEFYRELMGWHYRPGDEPPTDGGADDDSWLVLVDDDGRRTVAVQRVDEPLARPTWPGHKVPMQLHLDFSVSSRAELERHKDRAVDLGAAVLLDRSDDPDEALFVLADPAGHPFCLLTTA